MSEETVVFVLPGTSRTATGGAKMVYIYANHLVSVGYRVTICFDCQRMLRQFPLPDLIRRMGSRFLVKRRPSWFDLDSRVEKRCIFGIEESNMPNSDHVVATWVGSARPVASLSSFKGAKHYFIQGYETWGASSDEVEETYRLGMSNIVVSDWLGEIVEHASGVKPTKVKNPIDEKIFYPNGDERHDHEVALLYHPAVHKGFDEALVALELARRQVPDLVANVFGGPERPEWLPIWCRYTQNASQEQLRKIYSRSSIFLCATVNEGFGLTCPEAMFCGCALVSTDFLGVHEYAGPDCALLSPVHDPKALSNNLVSLLCNPTKARRIAEIGREHARRECSLSKALEAIEREFCSVDCKIARRA